MLKHSDISTNLDLSDAHVIQVCFATSKAACYLGGNHATRVYSKSNSSPVRTTKWTVQKQC